MIPSEQKLKIRKFFKFLHQHEKKKPGWRISGVQDDNIPKYLMALKF